MLLDRVGILLLLLDEGEAVESSSSSSSALLSSGLRVFRDASGSVVPFEVELVLAPPCMECEEAPLVALPEPLLLGDILICCSLPVRLLNRRFAALSGPLAMYQRPNKQSVCWFAAVSALPFWKRYY